MRFIHGRVSGKGFPDDADGLLQVKERTGAGLCLGWEITTIIFVSVASPGRGGEDA